MLLGNWDVWSLIFGHGTGYSSPRQDFQGQWLTYRLSRMISHNISTALIVESDADWDIRLKDIMPQVAQGVKTLVDWPFNKPHHIQYPAIEPYGDTWDVLWIGHCGSNHDGNIRIYSWNDTSVPPGMYLVLLL